MKHYRLETVSCCALRAATYLNIGIFGKERPATKRSTFSEQKVSIGILNV